MNKAVRDNRGIPVKKVPIIDGQVCFDRWSRGDVFVAIIGDDGFDQDEAARAYRETHGRRPPSGTTFHHDSRSFETITMKNGREVVAAKMQCVPKDLNSQVPHDGAASMAREWLTARAKKLRQAQVTTKGRARRLARSVNKTALANQSGFVSGRLLGGIAVSSIVAHLTTYAYTDMYLQSADKLAAASEALMVAKFLKLSREYGCFGDVHSTPFPSDSELERGVQLSLTLEASLNKTMEAMGYDRGDRRELQKFTVYNDLIIHIVTKNGRRYFQVQQVVPGEGVRTILKPGHNVGIGNWSSEINVVEGRR
jgi:hypothetical protein